ncbi:hypothetical protein GJAV_G00053060 [Gymnothorax javanicus]|nr:hypothetical protein GJAV_G00053060 [Gymnothorax javanicus]
MPCRHSVCLPCFRQAVQLASQRCPPSPLRVSSWARRQCRAKGLVNAELWDMVRKSYPEKCKRRMERQKGEEKIFCSPAHICKPGDIQQENELQKNMIFGVLSDLENEEPAGRRGRHASAFVRKTRSSSASSRTMQNRVVQRSKSCTDSEEGQVGDGYLSQLPVMAKASIAYSYNAGILLSTENSRSMSAPALASERRPPWRGMAVGMTSKPERSVSPESNDSISEELNHFKPIVCSPCTPPKRLPDGRLLEPTVIKSTPRNLSRSLQKPTSYEASPTILQKWRQIETDRQLTKVSSRGTVTSPALEKSALKQNAVEKKRRLCPNNLGQNAQKEQEKVCNKRRLIFELPTGEQSPSIKRLAKVQTPATLSACLDTCAESEEMDVADGSRPAVSRDGQIMLLYRKCASTVHCSQKPLRVQEQRMNSCKNSLKSRPSPRRGKKRNQKTKHLEVVGKVKGSRFHCHDTYDGEREMGQLYNMCLQQEREDHKLALKLQRRFNMECKKVDRGKTSSDKYLLRSSAFTDGNTEYNPRRSVRISKKS